MQEKTDDRRVVIITAFGIHDADVQREISEGQQQSSYMERLPQDILQAQGVRSAGLAACKEATAQTVRVAAGNGSLNSSPPPFVFILQNNNYTPGSFEQTFLDEVRRLQRQELEISGIGDERGERDQGEAQPSSGCDGGDKGVNDVHGRVFFVEDSDSLYGKLGCYQQTPRSQYHEPVKLVEAKMLWDLITLVHLEQSSPAAAPLAISQASEVDKTVGNDGVKLPVTVAKAESTISESSPDDAAWHRLQEASSTRGVCERPPCGKVSNFWIPKALFAQGRAYLHRR